MHEALKHAGVHTAPRGRALGRRRGHVATRRRSRQLEPRRRRPRPRRLRLARVGGEDPRLPGRPRARHPVPRHLPRHARRGVRVRAPRRRPRGRQLDRDGSRDAVPGDRPAPRAEGDRGPRRHHAPRRAGGRARGGHAGARGVRRGGRPRAPPPPLRGEQPLPAAGSWTRAWSSRAPTRRGASSRSSSCRTIPGSSRASSTRSSSRRPTRPAPLFRDFVGRGARRARARAPGHAGFVAAARARQEAARGRSRPDRRPELFTDLAASEPVRPQERGVADARDSPTSATSGSTSTRTTPAADRLDDGQPLAASSRPRRRRHADLLLRPPRHRAADGRSSRWSSDGVVRNAGGTILGADNKAAVAAMLEAVRRVLAEGRPHAGIELVFTTQEEMGLAGRGARSTTRRLSTGRVVFDQAAPIGDVSSARRTAVDRGRRSAATPRTPGCTRGRPLGHRGGGPRDRRPAPRALDEETTANVGRIAAAPRRTSCLRRARSTPRRARTTSESSPSWSRRCRDDRLRRRARRTRGREQVERALPRLPLELFRRRPSRIAVAALRRGRLRAELGSRAAARTPTSSTTRGLPCATSRNGMAEIHTPTSASPSPISRRWST